jgi:hypothetical protein
MSDVGINRAGLILCLTVATTLVAFLFTAAVAGLVAVAIRGASSRARPMAIRAMKMSAVAVVFLLVPIAVMNSGDNPRPAWIDQLAWPWIGVFACGCFWISRPAFPTRESSRTDQPITRPPG